MKSETLFVPYAQSRLHNGPGTALHSVIQGGQNEQTKRRFKNLFV